MNDPLDIFQDLYDSKISFSILAFRDVGFVVKLGDVLNGFAAKGKGDDMIEAALFLKNSAIFYYPDSEFSKKYGRIEEKDD